MIRYRFIFTFIVAVLLTAQSCKTRKYTTLTWSASEYKYNPSHQDSLYFNAFEDNDSTYLSEEINIKYILTVDSLIIFNGNNIMKSLR